MTTRDAGSVADHPRQPISTDALSEFRDRALALAEIGTFRYRMDGTVVYMDPGAVNILDLGHLYPDPTQVVGKNLRDLLTYTGEEGSLRARVLEMGEVRNHEFQFKTLRGQLRWSLHDSYLVRDAATGDVYVQVAARNITELKEKELRLEAAVRDLEELRSSLARKVAERTEALTRANEVLQDEIAAHERAEAAKRAGESQYRTLFESANDAILVFREDLWIDCNGAALRMFACTRDQLIGAHPKMFSPPVQSDGRSSAEESARRIRLAYEVGPQFFEWTHSRPDGTLFSAEVSLNRVDLGGAPHMQAVVRDVTDRKQAEEKIRQANQELLAEMVNREAVFESSPVGMLILDDTTNIVRANAAAVTLTGGSEADVLGHRPGIALRCVHSSKSPRGCGYSAECPVCPVRNGIEALLAEGGAIRGAEVPLDLIRNGTRQRVWLELGAEALQIDGRRHLCVALSDITERRNTEDALRESEERYAQIAAQSRTYTWETDLDGVYSFVGPSVEVVLGYRPDELVGKKRFYDLAPEEEREAVKAVGLEHMRHGWTVQDFDNRVVARDGRHVWVATQGLPLHDDHGGVVGFRGSDTDITERKRAERMEAMRAMRAQGMCDVLGMEGATEGSLVRAAAAILAALTRSQFGFAGVVDDAQTTVEAHLWLASNPDGSDEPVVMDVTRAAILGDAVGRQSAVVVEGHSEPHPFTPDAGAVAPGPGRVLVVPLVRSGRVVLLAGLADKDEPYEEADKTEVTALLGGLWGKLTALRAAREREHLEAQLRVAQKMEAIGRLAGGVAHDFNNLLSVILSYTSFALDGIPEDHAAREDLLEVQKAGERAASLTRQLLAFSRRQVLQPVVLDLNEVVGGVGKMLRRILGEDVEVVESLEPDLGRTLADPGQIEQVLVNLVVNSRDAMPEGGTLTIETSNADVDDVYAASHVDLTPGAYVRLTVSDTGIGMDEETRSRAFEPFFTTKERGKGTGLGLSTVHGIVHQTGGTIAVYSEPGLGTTFRLYLPRDLSAEAKRESVAQEAMPRSRGGETILVVDDEEALCRVTARVLGSAGYEVLSAASGSQALRIASEFGGEVSLLLTDVVMPQMDGRALAEAMARIRPAMEILYMSGYTDDAILQHGVLEADCHFIAKPFSAVGLTRKVREVLDGARGSSGGGGGHPPSEGGS